MQMHAKERGGARWGLQRMGSVGILSPALRHSPGFGRQQPWQEAAGEEARHLSDYNLPSFPVI